MFAAKLFTIFAIVFGTLEGLNRFFPFAAAVSVPLGSTFWVAGPDLVLWFCLVTSANFAVLYYAAERIFRGRWNRTLTLLHFSLFVCFAISLLVVFALGTRAANGNEFGESMRWIVIPWLLSIFSLGASFVVFAVNLTATVVQVVRAHVVRH